MIRVAFVCWGNICRSTLSESVFTYKVKELGLEELFTIDSLPQAGRKSEILHTEVL